VHGVDGLVGAQLLEVVVDAGKAPAAAGGRGVPGEDAGDLDAGAAQRVDVQAGDEAAADDRRSDPGERPAVQPGLRRVEARRVELT
jgi:hypothetical protein